MQTLACDGRNGSDTQVRLKLRDDLTFRHRMFGDEDGYVVEDPVRSEFYRIGIREHDLLRQLDGTRTVAMALRDARVSDEQEPLGPAEAETVVRWAMACGLIEPPNQEVADALYRAQGTRGARINPLVFKIPIINPNELLSRLLPLAELVFGRIFFIAWVIMCVSAIYILGTNWQRVIGTSSMMVSAGNWLQVAVAWVCLKILHEFAHGLALKRNGGDVPEFGILLVLFAPIGYTDASSSWRLDSMWRRIQVSAAGMYAEMFIAASAVWCWHLMPDGVTGMVALSTAFAGGLTTVIFNANPLMRFDGYYIFADLVGVPNLYTRGAQYVSYLARRYVAGLSADFPYRVSTRTTIVKCYGVATLLWRILVVGTLLLAASFLLRGAGVVISLVAAVMWFGPPLRRFFSALAGAGEGTGTRRARILLAISGPVLLAILAIPVPGEARAPGFVDYKDAAVVRATAGGIVSRVAVESHQEVREGDTLVELANPALVAERRRLDLEIKKSRIRSRAYHSEGRLAAWQSEERYTEELIGRRTTLAEQEASLVVRAPRCGCVIGQGLDAIEGMHIYPGDVLMALASEDSKEVRVSVSQDDESKFRDRHGQTVQVIMVGRGRDVVRGMLDSLDPVATRDLQDTALATFAGGTLSVSSSPDQPGLRLLLSPRFAGKVSLQPDLATGTQAGRLCTVSFRTGTRTIGARIARRMRDWYERIRRRAT